LTRVQMAMEVLRGIVPTISPVVEVEDYHRVMRVLKHWRKALTAGVQARIEEENSGSQDKADGCAGCELEEYCGGHPFAGDCARYQASCGGTEVGDGAGEG